MRGSGRRGLIGGAGKRWRYKGIGWPRSCAEIRLWIPGTVVVVALTIWGYVSIGPNGRLEPGRTDQHKTDFTVFTEAGAAFFDGRDPYRVTNPRGWHYLYPPLFALVVAPLSVFDTESQVVIWYVVNVVFAFGCFGEAEGSGGSCPGRRLTALSGWPVLQFWRHSCHFSIACKPGNWALRSCTCSCWVSATSFKADRVRAGFSVV